MELDLHGYGYNYVGPTSIYRLTWIELFRIIDASHLLTDQKKGVRKGDLDKFERFNKNLRK